MVYATVADFIEIVGEQESLELSNLDDSEAVAVNPEVIQGALEHGDAEINAYIAAFLPLAIIPDIFRYDCVEIARYRLDRYRSRQDVTDRYDKVIARLRDIAKGVIKLADEVTLKDDVAEPGIPGYVSELPVFTRESLNF